MEDVGNKGNTQIEKEELETQRFQLLEGNGDLSEAVSFLLK